MASGAGRRSFLDRPFGVAMVNEGPACSCPQVTVFECVIIQDVAVAHMPPFVCS